MTPDQELCELRVSTAGRRADPHERNIVRRRPYLEALVRLRASGLTLRQIGDMAGVCKENVRQCLVRAKRLGIA